MKLVSTDKKFTVPSGDRKIEVPSSEYPQYDSFGDAFAHLGGEAKTLEYFNAVVKMDSAGAAKIATNTKDAKTKDEAGIIEIAQNTRKNFVATNSGRSGLSKETYASIGKKIEAGFAAGTMTAEEVKALIEAARNAA